MAFAGDRKTQELFITEKNHLVREQSRDYLKSLGYLMIVPNINNQEDWWVDPSIISAEIINSYITTDKNNLWRDTLLKQ
jgi:hypothetical protein